MNASAAIPLETLRNAKHLRARLIKEANKPLDIHIVGVLGQIIESQGTPFEPPNAEQRQRTLDILKARDLVNPDSPARYGVEVYRDTISRLLAIINVSA